MHGPVGDHVVVVEEEHDRPGLRDQVVDQQGKRGVAERAPPGGQGAQRAFPDAGQRPPQRGQHVAPEQDRVVVAGVERDPGDPGVGRRRAPLGEQRGLPPARRGVEHGEPVRGRPEPVHEAGPGQQAAAGGRMQLRRQQHRLVVDDGEGRRSRRQRAAAPVRATAPRTRVFANGQKFARGRGVASSACAIAQAALTRPMWLKACGKLPSRSPVAGSTSSASSPTSLTKRAARSKTARARATWPASGQRLGQPERAEQERALLAREAVGAAAVGSGRPARGRR